MNKTTIYGHRGASGYAPQNTLSAFRKAVEMGAGGIELDVQLTRDGELVVIHDYVVDKLSNGEGRVMDKTLSELKELDFGVTFSPEYKGEKIPTLGEVMELLKEWAGILNIEIKSTPGFCNSGMEEKVVELVKKSDRIEKTIISSFNHFSLLKVKELEPQIKTGILYEEQMAYPWEYAVRIGAQALHPAGYSVTPEIIEKSQKAGLEVNIWTLNKPGDIKLALETGADGIITNYPDIALKIRSQMQNK